MAKVTKTCGKMTITFDDGCAYLCTCGAKDTGCDFVTTCPDGKGGYNITIVSSPRTGSPKSPVTTVAGGLEALAFALSSLSKRNVSVPERLVGNVVGKRTIRGTPQEVAEALGLTVGAKRKA